MWTYENDETPRKMAKDISRLQESVSVYQQMLEDVPLTPEERECGQNLIQDAQNATTLIRSALIRRELEDRSA